MKVGVVDARSSVLRESSGAVLEKKRGEGTPHELIRGDLTSGRIGLAKNRLPADTVIEDVRKGDVTPAESIAAEAKARGQAALAG